MPMARTEGVQIAAANGNGMDWGKAIKMAILVITAGASAVMNLCQGWQESPTSMAVRMGIEADVEKVVKGNGFSVVLRTDEKTIASLGP